MTMSQILRISEAASLALHTMVFLATEPDKKVTTNLIATTLQVSEAHLSKVLQRLSKIGLVKSIRGPRGGFVIGKPPKAISLLDVFEAIEGPIESDNCLFGIPVCTGLCILGGLVEKVNQEVKTHLAETHLDQLSGTIDCLTDR